MRRSYPGGSRTEVRKTGCHWTKPENAFPPCRKVDRYSLYLRREVLDAIGAYRRPDRDRILRFLDSLQIDPFQKAATKSTMPTIALTKSGSSEVWPWFTGQIIQSKS